MKPRDTGLFFRELISFLPKKAEGDLCVLSHAPSPKGTVVVVCGFGATHRSMSAIRKRLMRDGFDVVILAMSFEELQDGVLGLKHTAHQLKSLVDTVSARTGAVFLVAHSAGGLVARYYLQNLGGYANCKGLVTLGTPHKGTWVAALGFLTHLALKARVLWEMLPISSFIRELNKAPLSHSVAVLSICSDSDLLCPRSTTGVPSNWAKGQNISAVELAGLSHVDFLTSKTCYRKVSAFLLEQLRGSQPHSETAISASAS